MAGETEITRIGITGGPCAGKTTMLSYLEQELEEHGVGTGTVPETARFLIGAGIVPPLVGASVFQEEYIRLQMIHEDTLLRLMERQRKGNRNVLLCDRGTMDACAYLPPEEFSRLLAKNGWNIPQLRDARYEAVIHLVTAADGAEAFYVQDKERHETLEEARERDQLTQDAWVGHSHLSIIGNETDFEGKKRRVLQQILHHLGMPVPLEIEKKYRVGRASLNSLPRHAQKISIEQGYVVARDGFEERVRKRSQDGHSVCYRTIKEKVRPGVRREHEYQISVEEYENVARMLPRNTIVMKDRWCFLSDRQYFELDDLSPMGLDLCLLEIELTDIQQTVVMPSWMEVIEDVTDNKTYSNREIAFGSLVL
ncbi:MAG: hypothetical protein ABA06_03490 [Parcubacteria bacterium C7867-001]|nr:MAG: hypothetical protein ABA06_03490 [Parcubacteria bacterium C7867-001]